LKDEYFRHRDVVDGDRERLEARGAAMTNTPHHSGDGNGSYGWYSSDAGDASPRSARLGRSLSAAVAILGVATVAIGFESPVVLGFPVRLAALAAVIAAVGLLPAQGAHGWIVTALAVTGLVDALQVWSATADPHWSLTAIMAINAVQSLAAVGALVSEAVRRGSAGIDRSAEYSAYAQFAAAYQAYAAHYEQPPAQYTAAGHASAQAHAQAEAEVPAHAARTSTAASPQESAAALQASYAQYGLYQPARQPHGVSGGPATASGIDPGMPGANHAVPQPRPYYGARHDPGEAPTPLTDR
jgi:hypothetical protein